MVPRRWLFLLLVASSAPACTRDAAPPPGVADVREPERPAVAATALPGARVELAPAAPTMPEPAGPPAVQLTELAPTQGDLLPLLAAQVERAKKKGLVAVVEFYADWCAPCRVFQKKLDEVAVREALRGAFLIKLNLDDWHDKLLGTGYVVPSIPAFHLVKPDGRPSGKVLDGDKWGKPTTETIAASLTKLLGGR